jgi:hypothetical protein
MPAQMGLTVAAMLALTDIAQADVLYTYEAFGTRICATNSIRGCLQLCGYVNHFCAEKRVVFDLHSESCEWK